MNRIFLIITLTVTACADNGTVLGSHTSGGAAAAGTGGSGTTQPTSGGSSSSAGGNPNPGVAGMTSGSGGASSAGAPGSGGQPGAGTSGAAGTSSDAGAAGTGGAVNDECGGCTPPYQICIFQGGGPGPARYTCAEQQPCGSSELCACIVDQGPCTWVPDDDAGVTGECQCDNGLE